MLKHTPLARLGEPVRHRVCRAVPLFPASPWVSGQVLTVSGGGVQELDYGTNVRKESGTCLTFDAFADFRMDGHVAIVTGGAQNIGEGIARTFSGAGAKVMIADLNGEKAEATAAAIERPRRAIRCSASAATSPLQGGHRRAAWPRPSRPLAACPRSSTTSDGAARTTIRWPCPPQDMIESYKLNTLSAMQMVAACRPYLLKAENATITNSGSMVGVAARRSTSSRTRPRRPRSTT